MPFPSRAAHWCQATQQQCAAGSQNGRLPLGTTPSCDHSNPPGSLPGTHTCRKNEPWEDASSKLWDLEFNPELEPNLGQTVWSWIKFLNFFKPRKKWTKGPLSQPVAGVSKIMFWKYSAALPRREGLARMLSFYLPSCKPCGKVLYVL